jgi:hypothetical protein
MLLALVVACAADPRLVWVNLTDAPEGEVVRGARIALVESHQEGETRVTRRVGSACWRVGDAVSGAGTLSVAVAASESDAVALAQIPRDAVVRTGICHSDATPLARARLEDMFAVAIPSGLPSDFVDAMRTGDQVEMIATFAEIPPYTVSLGGAMFVEPGLLSVTAPQGERFFEAVDTGQLALALEKRHVESTRADLATLVPDGMRFVAGPLPASASAIAAFVAVAEEVDVTVDVDGQAVRALRAVPVFPLEPARRTVVAAVTQEEAETWAHAAATVPMTLSLRLEGDLRALAVPIAAGAAVAVGDSVRIGEEGARDRLSGQVLELGTDASGAPIALVQVTDEDVRAASRAGPLQATRLDAE